MKNRSIKPDDNWQTPAWLYKELDDEFHFDFDPCPYRTGDITDDIDGLLIEWGSSNFINPPYSRKLKDLFVQKAILVAKTGATCVLILPVSTSTKLYHEVIAPAAKDIRFIRGRIKFEKIDDSGQVYVPHNGAMHDTMIVIL